MNFKKRMFFFDIDNTILSSQSQKILPQTIRTIKILAEQKNTILGIATGRNIKRLNVLGDMLPYFKHLVLFNGGLTKVYDEVIDDQAFKIEDIQYLINKSHELGIRIGMTSLYEEVVPSEQDLIPLILGQRCCTNKHSIVAPSFHLYNKVYQIWLFETDLVKLQFFIKELTQFEVYYWRTRCGVDLVPKGINKTHGIKQIKKLYPEHKLICMGDGVNDIDMIKLSDIGIGLGNSDYEEIKKNSSLIAPHIEEDKLYDFFKQNNLF
ncbi:MAG: HAD-IIB family hydrolase [Phytoplasma sp.]|uniref:HAD-IIB family hydrolase n=1 Tax=Phytoplasma sp. TaxID=2155 RepID=UPI002B4109E5|nr:HAD-IIB family hydrolase [Phytoplasma sp.]WRH06814.1 MAG: HAD-IIB family hydrolase [Phytoplasma sp.]